MEIKTVQELVFWSYANLAMAHSALTNGQKTYSRVNYMIRARLYKGLTNGTMSIHTLFDDEKVKIINGTRCAYCGSYNSVTLDHIFSQKLGGTDDAENLICACQTCNSSKGKTDMVEWFVSQNQFPPILLLRRYLKLVYQFCEQNDLLNELVEQVDDSNFPFKFQSIPRNYPTASQLILYK